MCSWERDLELGCAVRFRVLTKCAVTCKRELFSDMTDIIILKDEKRMTILIQSKIEYRNRLSGNAEKKSIINFSIRRYSIK